LRAVCIIFTIFNHIEGVPSWINGGVGVDIFFVLSGFLITGILINGGGGDGFIRSFYIRRFFRIAPIYYLSFFLTAVAALLIKKIF
jgi:peptidoglycan/LPS O-acetylase OafA/YrhL